MRINRAMARAGLSCLLALGMLCIDRLCADEQVKGGEQLGWGHCATIAEMSAAPTLDGTLTDGEWNNATGTVNFLKTDGKLEPSFWGMHMDRREGRTLAGFKGTMLYIAIQSALPPRPVYPEGKHSEEKARDAELISDFNAIEIWLDPNRDRRESKEGDQAFYQFFINTLGNIYDAKITPGGAPDKGWNADIQSAHHIDGEKKVWTAEISVDMTALGWKAGDILGHSMGMLIARNYKAPWSQPTWFPQGGPFVGWYLYPQVFFTKDAMVTRIDSLGDKLWDAQPEFKVRLMNPGPARKAVVQLHIKSSDMPDLKNDKELDLPAGGSAAYGHAVQVEQLHPQADHYFNLKVLDKATGALNFHYTGMWTRDIRTTKGSGAGAKPCRWSEIIPLNQKWTIREGAAPDNALSFAVYPTLNLMKLKVDCSQLVADPEGADTAKLSDSAIITVTAGDKELARETLSWDLAAKQYGAQTTVTLKAIPEGEYVISAQFNRHEVPIVQKYTRIKYEWEDNKIGMTDTIYPPFEPVKATATTTAVVLRKYGVGELGLWNSVETLGKEILAGPIVLRADESRTLTGTPKLTASVPMAATYAATARDDAVIIDSTSVTEIDGCMKLTLTLKPGVKKQELKRLTLDIPLKAEHVPLWHAVTTAIRVNPMGETPKGAGVVWDSNKFPNGDWIGAFVPYLWLGGVERGLCVFGNNDKGWVLNWNEKKEFTPCQEMIRSGDTVTIRLNLVQKPIVIDEPRTIVIGLQASPTKPIAYKDWRSITVSSSTLGAGWEYLPAHLFDMGWGRQTPFATAYPFNRDYSLLDAANVIPGTEAGELVRSQGWAAFVADWKKRNHLDKPVAELSDGESRASRIIPGASAKRPFTYNSVYWDEYGMDYRQHPEVGVFYGEWANNIMAQSRRNFRCFHAAETVKRGVGLYFDNSWPKGTKDLLTSDAYEIPGLGIQCSASIWEQRDYHRRIWNIHREYGARWNGKPMSLIHMTNTNVLPYLTWNDMNGDLEWYYGPEPQQSKYGLPLLQAETSGRQSGCIPYAMATIENTKSDVEMRMAARSKFGAMMVHGILVCAQEKDIVDLARVLYGFGYGFSGLMNLPKEHSASDTVYEYWGDEYPLTCDNALVKTMLVKRGGELLLLACSWDKDPVKPKMMLDMQKLGLTLYEARDAEGTVDEQIARSRKLVEARKALLSVERDRLAAIEKNPNEAAKNRELQQQKLALAEKRVAQAEELEPVVKAAASLPIEFNPKTGALSIEMEGYGVRMIRLK